MTPDQIAQASSGLRELSVIDSSIQSIKSKSLQVMFDGRYWDGGSNPEIADAARLGLTKLFYEKRSTKIAELRALGVELPE